MGHLDRADKPDLVKEGRWLIDSIARMKRGEPGYPEQPPPAPGTAGPMHQATPPKYNAGGIVPLSPRLDQGTRQLSCAGAAGYGGQAGAFGASGYGGGGSGGYGNQVYKTSSADTPHVRKRCLVDLLLRHGRAGMGHHRRRAATEEVGAMAAAVLAVEAAALAGGVAADIMAISKMLRAGECYHCV